MCWLHLQFSSILISECFEWRWSGASERALPWNVAHRIVYLVESIIYLFYFLSIWIPSLAAQRCRCIQWRMQFCLHQLRHPTYQTSLGQCACSVCISIRKDPEHQLKIFGWNELNSTWITQKRLNGQTSVDQRKCSCWRWRQKPPNAEERFTICSFFVLVDPRPLSRCFRLICHSVC